MNDVYIGKGKIAGKGVYAGRDFEEGELVMNWNLQELTQEEFDALPKSEHKFVHSFHGKMFLFPEPARHTNHSANPSVRSDFEKQCDYAIQPIKKGEPITIDVNLEVLFELETFVNNFESVKVRNFQRLKGGYRNAVVSYLLPNMSKKTLILKRVMGNWHVQNEP